MLIKEDFMFIVFVLGKNRPDKTCGYIVIEILIQLLLRIVC